MSAYRKSTMADEPLNAKQTTTESLASQGACYMPPRVFVRLFPSICSFRPFLFLALTDQSDYSAHGNDGATRISKKKKNDGATMELPARAADDEREWRPVDWATFIPC